jgi:hypothetical protein
MAEPKTMAESVRDAVMQEKQSGARIPQRRQPQPSTNTTAIPQSVPGTRQRRSQILHPIGTAFALAKAREPVPRKMAFEILKPDTGASLRQHRTGS